MNFRNFSALLACAAVAALGASTAFASSTADKPHAPGTHKRTYDRVFKHNVSKKNKNWAKRVARCESGGDPNAIGAGGAYRGAFQFCGRRGRPRRAPPAAIRSTTATRRRRPWRFASRRDPVAHPGRTAAEPLADHRPAAPLITSQSRPIRS